MDSKVMIDRLNEWLDAEFRISGAHMNPAVTESQRTPIKELAAFLLTAREWTGDAPYNDVTWGIKPSLGKKNRQEFFDKLGRRTFFKADFWSAPDLGGVARCLLSDNEGQFDRPSLVFDLAEIDGTTRLVAVHNPCPACHATGLVDGAVCNHTAFGGTPCVDGMLGMGGLAFDPGEHTGSERFESPAGDDWAAYMDR